jgi:hypothetical protein
MFVGGFLIAGSNTKADSLPPDDSDADADETSEEDDPLKHKVSLDRWNFDKLGMPTSGCQADEISTRKFVRILLEILSSTVRKLESFTPNQPHLDTTHYQAVDLLRTIPIISALCNPQPFMPRRWLRHASVGGLPASSEAHALSLLSMHLSTLALLPVHGAVFHRTLATQTGERCHDTYRAPLLQRGAFPVVL